MIAVKMASPSLCCSIRLLTEKGTRPLLNASETTLPIVVFGTISDRSFIATAFINASWALSGAIIAATASKSSESNANLSAASRSCGERSIDKKAFAKSLLVGAIRSLNSGLANTFCKVSPAKAASFAFTACSNCWIKRTFSHIPPDAEGGLSVKIPKKRLSASAPLFFKRSAASS